MNPDDSMDPIGIDDNPVDPTPPPPAPSETAGAADSPEPHATNDQRVPRADYERQRARADAAEARAESLARRITELEAALTQAREALDAVERRQRIDRALMEADAHDLESARLLTEVALGAGTETDIDSAVAELRRRKPFLFRQRSGRAGASAPRDTDALSTAAEHAARTGDRRALLRYLELRRKS